MKRILITGANSYIGTSLERWLLQTPADYQVDTLDMQDDTWRDKDFGGYNTVFHVAGIAHADVEKVSEERKQLYYQVNTKLALETAEKAKNDGVKQFIFMSSIIVYAGCKEKIITVHTQPKPLNFYGDSKWQAEIGLCKLETDKFRIAILRPPMIYGKGSKGNYPQLAKLAVKLPFFPVVRNMRSMLYIDNLNELIRLIIDNEDSGVFFPQNSRYVSTHDMVREIATVKKHKIVLVKGFGWLVKCMSFIPGKIGKLVAKAFGSLVYDMTMSEYSQNYRVCSFEDSIRQTEG